MKGWTLKSELTWIKQFVSVAKWRHHYIKHRLWGNFVVIQPVSKSPVTHRGSAEQRLGTTALWTTTGCHIVLLRSSCTECFLFVQILHMSVFFNLLIGHEHFHTEHEYHGAKKRPFYLLHQGWFVWAFALQPKASTNHDGCAEWMSCPCPTTSTMAESHSKSQHI